MIDLKWVGPAVGPVCPCGIWKMNISRLAVAAGLV